MNKKAIIKSLTISLIKLKTLSRNSREVKTALKIIRELIQNHLDFKVKIREFQRGGSVSLLIQNKNITAPKVLLVGHIDVVPGQDSLFYPKIKEGLILGRGALDMKGPLAAMIFSFITALKNNDHLPVGLLITSDEETGGKNGAGWLVSKFKNCKVVIIPDAQVNFDLVQFQKAPFHFKITTEGRPAHASRPWTGKNAIEKLILCLGQIKSLANNRKHESSICITQISGGEAMNKIPQKAFAVLDARLVRPPNEDRLIKKVQTICKKQKCIFEGIDKGLLFTVDKKNNFLDLWKKIAERKLKKRLKFVRECSASDARFFAAQNIPVILTSPIGFGQHSEQEGVNLKSLYLLSDIIKEFLLKVEERLE